MTLPGQGDGATAATLDDQVAPVVAAVDSAAGEALVVGPLGGVHPGVGGGRRATGEGRPVALIGGFPCADGERYADFFELTDGVVPFPGWEPFEGPDSDDLDEDAKAQNRGRRDPRPRGA